MMDDFISHLVKFLSNTVVVRVYSYPQFAIETFLACVVCVVHFLLIFEVNTLVRRTNARAAARLQLRHPIKEVESYSYHSITSLRTTIAPKKGDTYTNETYYIPFKPSRVQRKYSGTSKFAWVISQGDSVLRDRFQDRVENLLSVSPSEYIRRDKERKNRQAGLKSCIQSLTSLLEKTIHTDQRCLENISKEVLRKSINQIKENLETQLSKENNSFTIGNFPTASLQSLIARSTATKALKEAISPSLTPSVYRVSNIKATEEDDDDDEDDDSLENLSILRSTENSSDVLFRNDIDAFFEEEDASCKFAGVNRKNSRFDGVTTFTANFVEEP